MASETTVTKSYNHKPLDEKQIKELRVLLETHRDYLGYRTCLLNEMIKISHSEIIEVYEKYIRRNLNRMKLPIKVYEPMSMLQRLCEELEWSCLLDKAAEQTDPKLRMAFVLAFSNTTYAHDQRFIRRPFAPLRFETFECTRHDKGWRFFAEQVSVDPMVSVAYTENQNWTLCQEFTNITKFHGVGLESIPLGGYKLTLKNNNEVYRWSKVGQYSNIQQPGEKEWADFFGIQHVKCYDTNLTGCLIFSKKQKVKGWIESKNSIEIEASPLDFGIRRPGGEYSFLWVQSLTHVCHEQYYNFGEFTVSLNDEVDLKDVKDGKIALTDSRLRPDIRHVELGDPAVAEKKHGELIQSQKKLLKSFADQKDDGFWFKKHTNQNPGDWLNYHLHEDYWQCKEKHSLKNIGLHNIFNLNV